MNEDETTMHPSAAPPAGAHTTALQPPRVGSAVIGSQSIGDLSRLRLSQNFAAETAVKPLITTVPVGRPPKTSFFRTRDDESYQLSTMLLELKEDRQTYIVDPSLWEPLRTELVAKVIFTAITRQNVLYLWPVRLPSPDGRHDEWNRSAMVAAETAKRSWVRMAADMHLGAYQISEALGDLGEPQWPDLSMAQLVDIAFRDRFIDDWNHPVLRRLRGEE